VKSTLLHRNRCKQPIVDKECAGKLYVFSHWLGIIISDFFLEVVYILSNLFFKEIRKCDENNKDLYSLEMFL